MRPISFSSFILKAKFMLVQPSWLNLKSFINTVSVCYINLIHIYFSRPGRSVLPFHSTGTVERTMLKLVVDENKSFFIFYSSFIYRVVVISFLTTRKISTKNCIRSSFVQIYHLLRFAQDLNCSFPGSRKGSGKCSNNCNFFDKKETWTNFHFPSHKLS